MNIIHIGVLSFLIFSSSQTIDDIIPLEATNFAAYGNKSSSSHYTNNWDKILILHGVTLIDGTGSPPKLDAVIIINIDDNKIIAATNYTNYFHNRDNLLFDDDEDDVSKIIERVVNLTGKYIVPGLFDVHAHVAGVLKNSYDHTTSENTLGMLLDHGITTIRNPGGPTNESVSLKEEVFKGNIKGPEIFTAGRLLNSPQLPVPFVEDQVTSEEAVRQEVRRQAAIGVDYIKLYVGLKPDLVKAAIDEAHNQGIKVIGHLYYTSWTDAANLGIDFLTHGIPVSPFLLSEDKQQIFNLTGGGPFDHSLWLDLVDLNSTEIRNMIDNLVENQIPVDPTLSIYEAIFKQDSTDPQNEQRWTKVLQLTKMMHESGVTVLSGSDLPNFGLVPGESLHHELELLVEAGITPRDVIKIATGNGAEALDLINQTGTIEPGKQADILILSANPAEDIENIKRIDAVISNGRGITK